VTISSAENIKERDHFRNIGVDGTVILNWISQKESVRAVTDTVQWRALVFVVIYFRLSQKMRQVLD
jgi:hypothetical protein